MERFSKLIEKVFDNVPTSVNPPNRDIRRDVRKISIKFLQLSLRCTVDASSCCPPRSLVPSESGPDGWTGGGDGGVPSDSPPLFFPRFLRSLFAVGRSVGRSVVGGVCAKMPLARAGACACNAKELGVSERESHCSIRAQRAKRGETEETLFQLSHSSLNSS